MQFPTISIQKTDDRSISSKSLDNFHNSWKLEKIVDDKGKTNYKLITSDNKSISGESHRERRHKKSKHVQQHKSIAAYGVPGSNAYLNNKAPTLDSSIMKTVKRVATTFKKSDRHGTNKKKTEEPIDREIQDLDVVQTPTETPLSLSVMEYSIERYAEINGQIYPNMIIGNDQTIVEYESGNDLLMKSYSFGHLITSAVHIKSINILLSYFGHQTLPSMTLSIWSQIFSPQMELVNICSLPIRNLQPNKGKLIVKDLRSVLISKGQLFLTLNFDKECEGDISIKYNIKLSQAIKTHINEDLNFEFPDFFNTTYSKMDRSMLDTTIDIPRPESQKANIPAEPENNAVAPIDNDLPQLAQKTIFGDFIAKKTNDNIPIFGNKKQPKDPKADDVSNYSVNSTYVAQIRMAMNGLPENLQYTENDGDEGEFSEKDDTDINNILNVLRTQNRN